MFFDVKPPGTRSWPTGCLRSRGGQWIEAPTGAPRLVLHGRGRAHGIVRARTTVTRELTSSLVERENGLPLSPQIDDRPTAFLSFVERLVRLADFGMLVIGPISFRVRGVNDEAKAGGPGPK